ncbi:MAG: acyloxyacyl hydrolase [Armatimonadota bacterium]
MIRKLCLWTVIFVLGASCSRVCAQAIRFDSMQRGQRDITLYAGFGANHKIPDSAKDRFSFDLIKLRYGVFTSSRTQLGFSLGYGDMDGDRDQDNGALWSTINYRRYFLVRGRTALGYDASFGVMHFNDRVSELGTKTNFTEQLGLTFEYGLNEDSSFTLEYVFSHASNAGIKLPNLGINASMVAVGYSWFR